MNNPPDLDNRSPYAARPLHLTDEGGRPLLVVVVKATCAIRPDGPALLPDQPAIDLEGSWWGAPGRSSPRTESETAFIKPATDVVLIGHAHAPGPGCTRMEVHCTVGPLVTTLRISGDRVWRHGWFGRYISEPRPFERLPLIYEHAFGGADGPADDPARQLIEERNPIGRGFRRPRSPFIEGVSLPNIEDPADPVVAWGQRVAVAGVGFLAPGWQPRHALAGTFDEAWRQERPGLLPRDFNRAFFNAAHPRLISRTGHLRGDEAVCIRGAASTGDLFFQLPRFAAPTATVVRRVGTDMPLVMAFDTVLIDTDAMHLSLLWRGHTRLVDSPLEVAAVVVDDPALVRPSWPGT